MAAVNPTRKNGVLLVSLLFVQLVLMSASVKGSDASSRLEHWLVAATSPVVSAAEWVGGGVGGIWRGGGALVQAHRKNAELETEIHRLRAELRSHREAAGENRRLRDLLSMRTDMETDAIGASIVTASVTGSTRILVIDRGTKAGLTEDLPVVARGSAVGRIVAVFDDYSKVLLLSDSDSGVGGVIQRSRAQGVVLGKGSEVFELQYVPRFSDVVKGDRVVTSALDGVFPRGFGIGTVVSIDESSDGTKRIFVKPELNYSSLEEVLVLLESTGGGVVDLPEVVDRR
jgi:rod shape-determining protein MreC